jgi:hypothetical protein
LEKSGFGRPTIFYSTDFADYTDYHECAIEVAKSVGLNSPQLAAIKIDFILY